MVDSNTGVNCVLWLHEIKTVILQRYSTFNNFGLTMFYILFNWCSASFSLTSLFIHKDYRLELPFFEAKLRFLKWLQLTSIGLGCS